MLKDSNTQKNVLGESLKVCCTLPLTGFYRNGLCETGPSDHGTHTVCAIMTDDFLEFSKSKGNDLSTPRPEFRFPGLTAGDKWCLCAIRWKEAYDAGMAPKVILEATNKKTLDIVSLSALSMHAISE